MKRLAFLAVMLGFCTVAVTTYFFINRNQIPNGENSITVDTPITVDFSSFVTSEHYDEIAKAYVLENFPVYLEIQIDSLQSRGFVTKRYLRPELGYIKYVKADVPNRTTEIRPHCIFDLHGSGFARRKIDSARPFTPEEIFREMSLFADELTGLLPGNSVPTSLALYRAYSQGLRKLADNPTDEFDGHSYLDGHAAFTSHPYFLHVNGVVKTETLDKDEGWRLTLESRFAVYIEKTDLFIEKGRNFAREQQEEKQAGANDP